jgi:hypothetical protein
MLEKSQSYALDNYVRAFRVPTTNSTGTIRYYDVTIKLVVNPDGTLNPVANVSASLSPAVTGYARDTCKMLSLQRIPFPGAHI